jgi:hypothetical protein
MATRGISPSTVPQIGTALNTIEKFRSETRKRDFARSHRFEVQITPPAKLMGEDGIRDVTKGQRMATHKTSAGLSARHLSLFVEDALIPGLLIGTRPIRLNNLNEQRANAIDFGGDSISLTFLVDSSWTAKDFFGDWMRGIVNKQTREIAFPNDYYGSMEITALDNKDQVVAKWILEDVFPRSIAPIQMSSANTQVVRMPVTFAYKRWFVVWPTQK